MKQLYISLWCLKATRKEVFKYYDNAKTVKTKRMHNTFYESVGERYNMKLLSIRSRIEGDRKYSHYVEYYGTMLFLSWSRTYSF